MSDDDLATRFLMLLFLVALVLHVGFVVYAILGGCDG